VSFNSKQVKNFHTFSNLIQSTCYRNNQTSPKWPIFLFFSPFFEKIMFRPLNDLIIIFVSKFGAISCGVEPTRLDATGLDAELDDATADVAS
jgi:hypothetical protein